MFLSNLVRIIEQPIFNLLLLVVAIWTVGIIFERLRFPLILGELLAGLILGPAVLNWIRFTPTVEILAHLGMFFMMFYIGLESDPKELRKNVRPSSGIALGGITLTFLLGISVTLLFGGNILQALLIGAAISGTSLVTKMRILEDLKLLRSRIGYCMAGAGMMDNIFAFAILAVVIKALRIQTLTIWIVLTTLIEVAVFFGLVLFLGFWIYPRVSKYFATRRGKGFTFALLMGLIFGVLAELLGLHFVIGAYLAGLLVREEIMSQALFQKMNDRFLAIAHGFLGPIFIFSVAFYVNFSIFKTDLLFLVLLLLAAMVGKIIGAGGGGYLAGLSKEEALTIGWGMNGRGTVELIIAFIGLELGILTQAHLSILLFIAFATTLLAPLGLIYGKAVLKKQKSEAIRNQSR